MQLTTEQQIISDHVINSTGLSMISAVAGSGKTSLLVAITKRLVALDPTSSGIYLAYNKSVATEAKTKFPTQISCMTTHSLAYKPTVVDEKLKLGKFTYRQIHENIEYELKVDIINHIRAFCLSSYLNVDDYASHFELSPLLTEYLHKYLDLMITGKSECTHEFYLKLFHIKLAYGNITYPTFDIIALDESGDLNPVTLEIFKLLPAVRKIMVGDPHQNIYQFNHTINCFSVMQDQGSYFPMTQSFRVDKDIAFRIQKFCRAYLHEDMSFKGTTIEDKSIKTRAYISRTNSALIRKLMELNKLAIPYKTIRDIKDIFALPIALCSIRPGGFTAISEYKYLQDDANNYGKSKELQSQYKTLLLYLRDLHEQDFALQQAIALIFQYGKSVIINCFEISKKHSKVSQTYLLGTVHSCKGLEMDSVELADDMNQAIQTITTSIRTGELSPEDLTPEERAELNLYYVACSRAKKEIHNAKYL